MAKSDKIISNEDIKHIAQLASITISDEDIPKFRKEIEGILKYFKKINEVDTSEIEVTSHTGNQNVMREDEDQDLLSQKDALSPREKSSLNGYFRISNVIDK
jgi:aspartyl-tRNA(Asn)/glutamyl-tRNA(Gln) amidotransferase subunit C